MSVPIERNNVNWTKWIIVVAGIIIAGLVYFYVIQRQTNSPAHKSEFAVHTYHSGSGWGYTITSGKRVVIKQPYIPAVQGLHTFKTEQQARQTARLVVQKLKRGRIPRITDAELDSLGIDIQ